ncbi:MAG TPA: hypothetical protein VFZ09_44720 [Archangium sp.]|uniref:hypothetical protein n=1 Tax=Archangium sp. TaxID=1872627 RepID=UPI002E2F9B68|nr:hypothetical protein [Archangium sp.]HEX5753386.1 hypothetical protein [Archangium sp.]
MTSALLVLLLLSQAERPATAMPSPLAASMTGGWRYLTRLEITGLALLPDGGVGGVESYAQLTPMLIFHARCSPCHSSLCVSRGARVPGH